MKQQHKDDEISENDQFELDFALHDNKINLNPNCWISCHFKMNIKAKIVILYFLSMKIKTF